MTVRKAYEWGSEILAKSGIEEAQLDAWYLLEFVTGMSRAVYSRMQTGRWRRKRKRSTLR